MALFALGCFLEPVQIINDMGSSPFFKFWDKISYAHYMVHYFILIAIEKLFPIYLPGNDFGLIIAMLIITVLPLPLSVLVNKHIEEPASLKA
jgi:peptidoglycan/LPS O-acetylase OafA/YrhL